MAADQLNGVRSFVGDADGIKEEPVVAIGAGAARIVLGLDADANVSGGGFRRMHSIDRKLILTHGKTRGTRERAVGIGTSRRGRRRKPRWTPRKCGSKVAVAPSA